MSNIHDLINKERKRRHLPHIYWSREMARLAQSQADYCAKVGRMVHSDRYAFQGGENLCGGKGKFSAQTVVNTWLKSRAGHREYLLASEVTKAGVGIARHNGKMFVAWAFSNEACSYPDCFAYKDKTKNIHIPNPLLKLFKRRQNMAINPFKVGLSMVLGFIGFLGMALGVQGIYVYFNRLELLLGGEGAQFLLMFDVPVRFRDLIIWASASGLQTWVIPSLVFLAGLWVFNYSRLWDMISDLLDKIRP